MLVKGLPRESVGVAPNGKEAWDVATGCGDEAEGWMLLQDDQVAVRIVVEGLIVPFSPRPVFAAHKTIVTLFKSCIVRVGYGDVKLAQLICVGLWVKGMREPVDGGG